MSDDEIGKINPTDLPSADEKFLQSDAERAVQLPANNQTNQEQQHEEETTEFVLTPEIEEMIMAKVQDLLQYGVAFSTITRNGQGLSEETTDEDEEQVKKLKSSLALGLLGTAYTENYDRNLTEEDRKSNWARNARMTRDAVVHFNIVGRSTGQGGNRTMTGPSGHNLNTFYSGDSNVSAIFDISDFEDTSGEFTDEFHGTGYTGGIHEAFDSYPGKTHTYRTNNPDEYAAWRDDPKGLESTCEYGFVAYHRIAPRRFTGLFIDRSQHIEQDRYGEKVTKRFVPDSEVDRLVKIMTEAYKGKEELLLPIYDDKGNLLWPKHLNHQKIQEMLLIKEIGREKIAFGEEEITEKTTVYIGPLFPGMFEHNFEHVYTSYPEKEIVQDQLAIGGQNREILEKHLYRGHIRVDSTEGLPALETLPEKQHIKTIRLKVEDLGFPKTRPTVEQIYTRAQELGLELCPQEAAIFQLLKDGNRYENEYIVAMKPMRHKWGSEVFYVYGRPDARHLSTVRADPDIKWSTDEILFCVLPKSKANSAQYLGQEYLAQEG